MYTDLYQTQGGAAVLYKARPMTDIWFHTYGGNEYVVCKSAVQVESLGPFGLKMIPS